MMWIYREDGSISFSLPNDEALFRHIMDIENAKLLPGHPQFGQSEWSFTHYSANRVKSLYTNTLKHLRTPPLKQAYEQETGLLEIYTGNIHQPVEIVVTPSVDIKALQKQWCLDYCKAHHYNFFEAPHPLPLPSSSLKSHAESGEGSPVIWNSLSSRKSKNSSQDFPSDPRGKIVYSS